MATKEPTNICDTKFKSILFLSKQKGEKKDLQICFYDFGLSYL